MGIVIQFLQGVWTMMAIPIIAYHGMQTGRNRDEPVLRQHHVNAVKWHIAGGPFEDNSSVTKIAMHREIPASASGAEGTMPHSNESELGDEL